MSKRKIYILVISFITMVSFYGCGSDNGNKETDDKSFEAIEKEIKETYKEKVERIQEEVNTIQADKEKEKEPIITKMAELRDDAIAGYENFIMKYQDSEYSPDVLVRLGESYFERSEERQIEAMVEFEKQLENMDPSMSSNMELIEPSPHYEDLIRVYQQLILKYPNFEYADVAYYGLGYCLASQGENQDALEMYTKLVNKYPESSFVDECYLRIGDLIFDKYEFEEAISFYRQVSAESRFYDMALYKIGWCYFNMSSQYQQDNYFRSVDAFCELLDYYQESEKRKTELENEAFEFSAGCFAELADIREISGYNLAMEYFSTNPKPYESSILHELGDVYLYKQDKVDFAMEVYEGLLNRDPSYSKATEVLTSMVEGYERQQNLDLANETRERIVDNYGPNSQWAKGLEEREDKIKAIEVRERNLYDAATYHHSKAQSLLTPDENLPQDAREELVEAINRYRQYLYEYPGNEKAYIVNYYLADALYNIGDYWNSGIEFERVSREYASDKFKIEEIEEFSRSDAAFNAVVSYNHIFAELREEMEPPELKERGPLKEIEGDDGGGTEIDGDGDSPTIQPETIAEEPTDDETSTSPGGENL